MRMKTLFIAATLLLIASFAFGADAIIKSFTGKVEIQEQGSSAWKSVTQGQKISKGAIISTGFNSNTVLSLGNSEIFVKPLTRISVNELMQQGSIVKTDLNLKLGKVTADVKTTEGLKNDFTLRTPVSTAAVRGTKFTAGVNSLSVEHGKIAYSNKIGQARTVSGGSSSSVSTSAISAPLSAGETAVQNFTVSTSLSKGMGGIVTRVKETPTGGVTLVYDLTP